MKARIAEDSNSVRTRPRRISVSSPPSSLVMKFPMYGLATTDVLKLNAVLMHEALKEMGLLVTVQDCKLVVIFISHTWLGYHHPDSQMKQLRALQRILLRLSTGERDISSGWLDRMLLGDMRITGAQCKAQFAEAIFWMDYWSVPQAAHATNGCQQEAIQSIPAYVVRADHFMVLVPPCTHVDQGGLWGRQQWSMRGWCRLEMISHIFSKDSGHVIIAESESRVHLATYGEWLNQAPGLGEMTCCQVGHKLVKGGKEFNMACDKEPISRVMRQLYAERVAAHLRSGDLQSFRLLLSLEGRLFAGLPMAPEPAVTAELAGFLEKYKFKSGFDEEGKGGSGWTPLRFAAYEENVPAVQLLLQMKADVESPLKAARPDVFHLKRFTILHGACYMNSNADILRLLLDHRASLQSVTCPEKAIPASFCIKPEGFRVLMEKGQSVNQDRNIFGASLLWTAAMQGSTEGVRFLMQQRADPMIRTSGGLCNIDAAVLSGNESVLQQLLSSDMEVEVAQYRQAVEKKPPYGLGRAILAAAAVANRLRPADAFWAFLAEWPGSSPLHYAAAEANLGAVHLLLSYGFTVAARNHRGRTPIHLACLFGHRAVLQIFRDQPEFDKAAHLRCTHGGKTAADLARKGGFFELLTMLPDDECTPRSCCRGLWPRLSPPWRQTCESADGGVDGDIRSI